MKKILSVSLSLALMLFSATAAFSKQLADVTADHWAAQEIITGVNGGVMGITTDGYFNPDEVMTRADFTSTLLKALGHKDVTNEENNKFKDVTPDFWAYNDILKSQRLGLIYGYGDNTFRPLNNITKAEVESVISHITEDKDFVDEAVLNVFKDKNTIPAWALERYAKAVDMGVYVNYPDKELLQPNKLLTRAECAVIMYKLRDVLGSVKKEFVAEEKKTATEHLSVIDNAKSNEVDITNFRKIIKEGNVLRIQFAEDFSSKRYTDGEPVKFITEQDIITDEGRMLIPANSQFVGVASDFKVQKSFNRAASTGFEIRQVILPNGDTIDFTGHTLKDIRPSKAAQFGKVVGYTVLGTAVGGGVGVGAGALAHNKYGTAMAIGLPVGAGVGLATGLVTKGLAVKQKVGTDLYIELLSDLVIRN